MLIHEPIRTLTMRKARLNPKFLSSLWRTVPMHGGTILS
jgi:hypothetical protein